MCLAFSGRADDGEVYFGMANKLACTYVEQELEMVHLFRVGPLRRGCGPDGLAGDPQRRRQEPQQPLEDGVASGLPATTSAAAEGELGLKALDDLFGK